MTQYCYDPALSGTSVIMPGIAMSQHYHNPPLF